VAHFPGSVIVLEQHGVVQVLGKLLSQIAKSQQILLHGKTVEAISGAYAATSRCRSKAIIITDQNDDWCLDWRQWWSRSQVLLVRRQTVRCVGIGSIPSVGKDPSVTSVQYNIWRPPQTVV
jgi:hypothetical protein